MGLHDDQDAAYRRETGVESVSAPAARTRFESDIADGIEYRLDPATVTVTRLTALIWFGSIAAPLWFSALLVALLASLPPLVKPVIVSTLAVLTAFFAFWATWCPDVRYRHISYRLDQNGFTIRRGVVWRGVTSIPKARVQHTDVVQGPLQRRFGLGRLVIHTAGTQDASVSLSGLAYEKALSIRDFLIESDERDGV